jgi:diguanylate cyclase (GGDEF)-like protein/PAS domain S-box-containing protein
MAVLRALAEADAARIQSSTQRQLDNESQLLSAVLDTSGALIVLVDRAGAVLRLNPVAALALGDRAAEAQGQLYAALFASDDERTTLEDLFASLAYAQGSQHVSWRATVNQRTILWSAGRLPEHGDASGYAVISGLDVTAQEQAEQQAYYLRHFDAVTGLPNRALLILRLGHLFATAADPHQALIMIGVSRLQEVRDSLGDEVANQLLREVSRRLLSWQFAGDCLARVGDDSFALLVSSYDEAALSPLLQEILVLLHQPFSLGTQEFFLSAYLGVALCPPGSQPAAVLQDATVALHQAEQRSEDHFYFYQATLSKEARTRLDLEGALHAALRVTDQLFLDYQPQIDLASRQIVGFEALMRWQHPQLGLLPPARFIPLAESCGLIAALGERALMIACAQAASWQAQGLPAVTVAVNLSALQWSQPGLMTMIQQALTSTGLAPKWLELELTESASMHDPVATLATMEQLHAMGVKISIDDFGTGFCNLGYLKRFPVDKLKIDQSFVRDISTQPDDLVISQLIVAMGHLLHIEVVAEGVETEEQLGLLAQAGCDIVQGFYFSRPVGPAACAQLLATNVAHDSGRAVGAS